MLFPENRDTSSSTQMTKPNKKHTLRRTSISEPATAELSLEVKQKTRFITLERFNAACTLAGVLLAALALYFQYGLETRQTDSERLIAKLSEQMSLQTEHELNPRPMIYAPSERVEFKVPATFDSLELQKYMLLRNMGKGNAHNIRVTFTYLRHGVIDDSRNESMEPIEIDPIIVADGITMTSGEELKLPDLAVPIFDTDQSQCIEGTADIKCLNDLGVTLSHRQSFQIILHLEEARPHAHFTFVTQFETKSKI